MEDLLPLAEPPPPEMPRATEEPPEMEVSLLRFTFEFFLWSRKSRARDVSAASLGFPLRLRALAPSGVCSSASESSDESVSSLS